MSESRVEKTDLIKAIEPLAFGMRVAHRDLGEFGRIDHKRAVALADITYEELVRIHELYEAWLTEPAEPKETQCRD